MRDPSSTYIFATRPGTLTASSERTGAMSSPVATIVPPDSGEATTAAGADGAVWAGAVDAAATLCTSLGSAGAACVAVAAAGVSFFAQPNGSARLRNEIVRMDERLINGLLPLQRHL